MYVRVRFILVTGIILALMIGCGGPPSTTSEDAIGGAVPLNWENLDSFDFNVIEAEPNLQIPAKHLYEWMYFSRATAIGGLVNDSAIQFFRDSILVDTLIGLTARDYDLAAHWYHFREYRTRSNNALRQAFWDIEVSSGITIDSQEVVDYYHENLGKFALPEQIEMYHILSSPLGFRQGPDSALVDHYTRDDLSAFAGEYVYRLYQLLKYGEAFENVAFNYSHDVLSRENGGRLGWTKRGTFIAPFDSVAFSLEDGEFSEPYQDGDGWHILYAGKYNPGGPQSLDSGWVYVGCQQGVFDSRAGELGSKIVDSLYQGMDIVTNDRILTDTLIYSFEDSVWAAVVNETDIIDVRQLKGMEEDFRRAYGVGNSVPEMRQEMIMRLAGPIRAVQAARAKGYDTLPDQIATDRRVYHETVKSLRLSQIYGRDDWVPTDSAMALYYQAHFDEYNPTVHIKAQQLIVQDFELANFLRGQANEGLDLEYLAEYYGDEEGYDIKFEDLGLVKRKDIDEALYLALENTHKHRISLVTQTDQGYHVAKILDRKYQQPLEMVRSEILARLIDQHRWQGWAAIRDELFKLHNVRFPGVLPPFELPRLSDRNHPRTLPKAVNVIQ